MALTLARLMILPPEAALLECPCGLLLVSHDERFLERTTNVRWEIEGADGDYVLVPSAGRAFSNG